MTIRWVSQTARGVESMQALPGTAPCAGGAIATSGDEHARKEFEKTVLAHLLEDRGTQVHCHILRRIMLEGPVQLHQSPAVGGGKDRSNFLYSPCSESTIWLLGRGRLAADTLHAPGVST